MSGTSWSETDNTAERRMVNGTELEKDAKVSRARLRHWRVG
jgi:hypothetical protein